MATEQYCLRWNDHRTILLSNFERLLKNSTSVDCTLAAEGQCLRAHKVVLSACSPYFEVMLNQDKEKHPIIFMKDMKYKELQAILEYMYRGEVVIPHDQLAALLHAAESLQIRGLGCGDKQATATGNQQLQQHQHQQPVQKLAQSFRQSGPTSRISETSNVTHEVAPQIVDLTEDRMPLNSSIHHMQESTKRSIPQAPFRAKRPAFSSGTPERNNQTAVNPQLQNNNRTTVSPQLQSNIRTTLSPQLQSNIRTTLSPSNNQNNLVAPKVSQASGGSIFGILNVATTSGGVAVASPLKQSLTITSRQGNESAGYSEHQTPQVVTPPIQRTETEESGKQTVHKPKIRPVPTSSVRRYAQAKVSQSTSGQNSNPIASSSQNSGSAEKTTAVHNTPNGSEDKPLQLNTRPSQLPEVQQTNCTVDEQVNDSTPKDSFLEPVADQTKETDAEKLSSENQNEANKEARPALNKPGPSGQGSTAKRGRRGRAPAGERRYQCPECDRKFTQLGYLEKHLRIHDGDCYQCDVCDKTFLSRPALVKHVRLHANKTAAATQHKCQLCGAVFSSASELEKHLTDHTLSVTDDNE